MRSVRIPQLNRGAVTLNFIVEVRNNNSRGFEILISILLLTSLLIIIIRDTLIS